MDDFNVSVSISNIAQAFNNGEISFFNDDEGLIYAKVNGFDDKIYFLHNMFGKIDASKIFTNNILSKQFVIDAIAGEIRNGYTSKALVDYIIEKYEDDITVDEIKSALNSKKIYFECDDIGEVAIKIDDYYISYFPFCESLNFSNFDSDIIFEIFRLDFIAKIIAKKLNNNKIKENVFYKRILKKNSENPEENFEDQIKTLINVYGFDTIMEAMNKILNGKESLDG